MDTLALRRVLPLCEARGIGAIVASPFAGGWLIALERAGYMYGEAPDHVRVLTERLLSCCRDFDVPIGAVALQFRLAHPAIATIIPGARSAEEANAASRLAHLSIPPELWDVLKHDGLLDEAAPTPAGQLR